MKPLYIAIFFILVSIYQQGHSAQKTSNLKDGARTSALSGTYLIGLGGDFVTLNDAIGSYNTNGLSGSTTFLLTDAIYASETYPMIIQAVVGSNFGLTIKPIQNTLFTGNSTTALLVLNGADFITLDGSINTINNEVCPVVTASRNITFTNTNTSTTSAVIWLQSQLSNGATNNVVKNCNIVGNGRTQTFTGIGAGNEVIGNNSLGFGNINNQFVNNQISRCQIGIYSQGGSSANKNSGTVISQNLIKTAAPNNVGPIGIRIGFDIGAIISGNTIDSLQAPATADAIAIALGSSSVSTSDFSGNEVVNATITNNIIGLVRGGNTYSAIGIYQTSTINSGTTLIANNMISGVNANGTAGDLGAGIFIGSVAGSVRVFHNSVTMVGTLVSGGFPSFAFASASSTTNLDIKNNIFTSTGSTGANLNRAMGFGYATLTNVSSNYNDLVVGGTGSALVQTNSLTNTGAVVFSNVLAWTSSSGKDANSVNITPIFTSSKDLHLVNTNTSLDNLGNPASVMNDIDCANRSVTNPDLGADEFEACFSPSNLNYTNNTATYCQNTPITPNVPTFTGNAATSFAVSPALPSGLTLNTITGVITGVPMTSQVATNYVVTVTNACGSTSRTVNISVHPILTVDVNISANPNGPICNFTPVTFTATPVNGGSNPTYQWFNGTNPVGTNSLTYSSPTLANGDVITARLTSSENCTVDNPKTSPSITMVVNNCPPDILASYFSPQNTIFNQGQTKDLIINLHEVNGYPTSGLIQVFIQPIVGFSIQFNPVTSNVPILIDPFILPVHNNEWTSMPFQGGLLLTSSQPMTANGVKRLAVQFTATSTSTTQPLHVQILAGSGGENNQTNNLVIRNISIN